MKHKKNWKIISLYVLAAIGLIMMIVTFRMDFDRDPEVTAFNTGWTVQEADGSRRPISVYEYLPSKKNEPVIIHNRVPAQVEEHTVLCFRSFFQSIRVWEGEELVYVKDTGAEQFFGSATPSGWNYVTLLPEKSGEELTLEIRSPYRGFSGQIGAFFYCNAASADGIILQHYLPSLVITIIVGFLGVMLYILSFSLSRRKVEYKSMRYFGLLVMNVAVWLLSETRLPNAVVSDGVWICGFLALNLSPLTYLLFLEQKLKKKHLKVIQTFYTVLIGNFFLMTILQCLNLVDFVVTAPLTHFFMITTAAYSFYAIFQDLREDRQEGKTSGWKPIELLGLIGFDIGVIVEIMYYYFNQYRNVGLFIRTGMLILIIALCITTAGNILDNYEESARLAAELQQSKTKLMLSQIQPHFIYNTLASIRTLIKKSPDDAYQMVYDFSRYLQANIHSLEEKDQIPFSQELEHIRAYTNIEQVRFASRLSVVFQIEEEGFYVPPLSIQPLVENAIKHGICQKRKGGQVFIRSEKTADGYAVTVEDDGAGFNMEDIKEKESLGLKNIKFRLEKLENASLEIVSEPGKGTRARVDIPSSAAYTRTVQDKEGDDLA
ncbi:sensor histidine kinase [Anaerolentibacter hominis]|uniref:sensor histidine kinase n=1 Tax=Anaerolentibacter hominis TaxID=3079009 RepID=UPI0031B8353D